MKVLIAVDGSEHSVKAAEQVGALVRQVPGAEVIALYVFQPITDWVTSTVYGTHMVPDIPLDVAISRTGHAVLERSVAALGLPAEQVQTLVETGNPVETILLVAKENKVDMIAVGSRGLGTTGELFLGSVSHQVVHRAPCPVLVVK